MFTKERKKRAKRGRKRGEPTLEKDRSSGRTQPYGNYYGCGDKGNGKYTLSDCRVFAGIRDNIMGGGTYNTRSLSSVVCK